MARKKSGGRVTPKLPKIVLGEDNPVLRSTAVEVEDFDSDLKDLVKLMFRKMDNSKGVGLAANQIGRTENVFVYDIEGNRGCIVNPRLVYVSDEETFGFEGCLSVPQYGNQVVSRPSKVTIKGFDIGGKPLTIKANDMLARVFIHETEHLEGRMYLDII